MNVVKFACFMLKAVRIRHTRDRMPYSNGRRMCYMEVLSYIVTVTCYYGNRITDNAVSITRNTSQCYAIVIAYKCVLPYTSYQISS